MKTYFKIILVATFISHFNFCYAQSKDTLTIKYVWKSVNIYDSAGNQHNNVATFTKLPSRQDSLRFGTIWPFKDKGDSLEFLKLYFKKNGL